jgi:hypothetical protein
VSKVYVQQIEKEIYAPRDLPLAEIMGGFCVLAFYAAN